jgi:hypothetical protein
MPRAGLGAIADAVEERQGSFAICPIKPVRRDEEINTGTAKGDYELGIRLSSVAYFAVRLSH